MKTFLKICCFLPVAALFFSSTTYAQGTQRIIIKGKVTDSKDKQTVIGASVSERDAEGRTVHSASTNIDGEYALQISNPKNSIQVSFIGYKTIAQPINNRTVINFSMVSTVNDLAEVAIQGQRSVGNGTGLNIDSRNSTVATATVSTKVLEELAATSIDQALQGRLPGVDVGTTSGDPGKGMSIRIRGTSTINGSADPLIVLDGIPYETQIPADFNFGTADEQGYAQLLNIAPSDIKDITVLKDAASTAVWGARAANGVLVITTKRGAIGKPIISYNLGLTRQKQPENIPLLTGDQYSNLIPEEYNNLGTLPLNISTNQEFLYDPLVPTSYYNYNKNSDWIAAITQIGFTQDHNISMQGGGEKARYFASLGYTKQSGTTIGTDLNRITTKINLDYNVSSRIRFRSDFTYTNVVNISNYASSLRQVAYSKMPNMAIYQYDEFGNQTPNYFSPASNIQGQYSATYNPLAFATQASSKSYGERVTPHFTLNYDILPNLLVSTLDLQFDINNTKSKNFLPQTATGRPITETNVNRAGDNDGDAFAVDTKLNFIFSPKLGEKQTLQTLLSFQTNDTKNISQSITTSNTASSFLQDPSNPGRTQNSDLTLSSVSAEQRTLGVVLTNQYSFLDRYIVNLGGRMDGNSRLGSKNRFGFFPSLSTRWRVSGEPFMKKFTWIDDLSFRLSYGQSGQQPSSNYSFYNTYNPTSSTYLNLSGVVPGNIGLDNLKYQVTVGRNVGFDLGTLKNKIALHVDLYNNKIKDLYFNNLAIPNYTGYSTLSVNVGTMENRGFEVSLNAIPMRTKNWLVGFDFNIAKNINVITSVSEYYPRTDGKSLNQNGVYRSYLVTGNPFGSFYGFKYKGVYSTQDATIARDKNDKQVIGPNGQIVYMRFGYPAIDYVFQPGDAKYEDLNHDGNINEDDIAYLGNGNPKVTGGFGPTVTFKGNLKIAAFFSYKYGYQLINQTLMNTTNMYGVNNQSTLVLQRWRNPGDVTDVPRALYNKGYNWLGSDRYVSDASFIRLKSVTARYNLDKRFTNKLSVKSASIYITAENLATWTKYKGVDPDVSARGPNTPFSYVADNSLTPPSKNLKLGLTVGF